MKNERKVKGVSEEATNHREEVATPNETPSHNWRHLLKRTKAELDRDNMPIVAAGVAFYLLIGIVPGLIALISIYGLMADPQQVQEHFTSLSGFLPGAATELLSGQMQRIAGNKTAAGWGAGISILAALWASSSAMKALVKALNIAYGETETRSFVKLTSVTLFLTLGAVVAGLVAIGAIVFLPIALDVIGIDNSQLIANLVRWPVLAIIAMLGLAVLYRFGPDRAPSQWRWISWGAVAAMLIFVLGSAAFAFYVSNFGKYNETYGSLAAVVIMLLWLYHSAMAILVGAVLNSQIEHQAARARAKKPGRLEKKRGTAPSTRHIGESYA